MRRSLLATLTTALVALAAIPGATGAQTSTWSALAPRPRVGAAFAYDAVHQRYFLFGGQEYGASPTNELDVADAGAGQGWNRTDTPALTPPARSDAACIYDAAHDRFVVVGGKNGSGGAIDDAWAFEVSPAPHWTQLATTGTAPAAGPAPSRWAAYDATSNRLVTFGQGAGLYDTFYALDLTTLAWTSVATTGSGQVLAKVQCTAHAEDFAHNRIFGLEETQPIPASDGRVWELDLSTFVWTPHVGTGTIPPYLRESACAYDPVGNQLVVAGGWLDQSWVSGESMPPGKFTAWMFRFALDGSNTWTELNAPGGHFPMAFQRPGIAFDPAARALVYYPGCQLAGVPSDLNSSTQPNGGQWRSSELYALPLDALAGGWNTITAPGPGMPRAYASCAADVPGRRMFVGGGSESTDDFTFVAFTDLYQVSLDDPLTWKRIPATGGDPDASSMVWAVPYLVQYSGASGTVRRINPDAPTPAWEPIATGVGPTAQVFGKLVYDPVRDRVLLIGGKIGGVNTAQVLTLSPHDASPQWTTLALDPNGDTYAPYVQVVVYDPTHDRVLSWGGSHIGPGANSDVFALELSGPLPLWHHMTAAGTAPPGLLYSLFVFDDNRSRALLFGGVRPPDQFNHWTTSIDVNALDLAGNGTWSILSVTGSPPSGGEGAAGAYDPVLDRLVLAGGGLNESHGGGVTPFLSYMDNQVYALAFPSLVGVGPTPGLPRGLTFESVRPNPSATAWTVAFTLPRAADATLTVHDVNGRIVLTHTWHALAAGRQAMALPEAAHLAPGLYFLRLRQGAAVVTGRAVRL